MSFPNPEQTAFLFPGQGSQKVGMGAELAAAYPVARKTFDQADEILGFPLSKLAWEGPEEELNDTINTQPALLVHSVAALRVYEELFDQELGGDKPQANGRPSAAMVAGHSLGELSALVAAGALEYSAALRLVRRRGELMQAAGEENPGGMAAILGLDLKEVEKATVEACVDGEIVQVANDNCPGQVVISGHSDAVERAMQAAKEFGAKRALPLAVSIAAHSHLMASTQKDFTEAISTARLIDPLVPVIGNVRAEKMLSAEEIRADLQGQLTSRVRWTESVEAMRAEDIQTFIELGSGSVLTGLLKRIDKAAKGISLGSPEDFEALLNAD